MKSQHCSVGVGVPAYAVVNLYMRAHDDLSAHARMRVAVMV